MLVHMPRTSKLLIAFATLLLTVFSVGATPANKCVVDGTVTYQQGPCFSGQSRKLPTLEQLNAEQQKRRPAAGAVAPVATAPSVIVRPATAPAPSPVLVTGRFSCDGRKHCTQMKSCAEANYFLANCPGVKMDGDKDGIPCEEQWCQAPMPR